MPSPKLYFEDFAPGRVFEFAAKTVSPNEIIAFAEEFDPQPMHLSEEAGRDSILGGLSASGWHTSAMFMRMMIDAYLGNSASEGAPGIDVMEWKKPVLAGDVLTGRSVVDTVRPMRSRPHIGIVRFRHELENQRGEKVLHSENAIMFRVRATEETAA